MATESSFLHLSSRPPDGSLECERNGSKRLTPMFGTVRRHQQFASHYVAPRHVEVWEPPDYQDTPSRRFPVIYMQDGQNLFDPQTSFLGVDWGIDAAMRGLIVEQQIRAALI